MEMTPLSNFRIPDYPHSEITIDGSPLTITNHESLPTSPDNKSTPIPTSTTEETDPRPISASLGLCTILHNWYPTALKAFLDLDAWFSFTLIRRSPSPNPTIEIGRVGNQITFGTLDSSGADWDLMLTYNIGLDGPERGKWIVNSKECMRGEEEINDVQVVQELASNLVWAWMSEKVWESGKRVKHEFYVEYAPMDIWGDGICMNPHWLYESLSLEECTTCHIKPSPPSSTSAEENIGATVLHRCGKCGTATYCSAECQRKDWPVHKHVCSLSLEDRGQMLAITEKGGLIGWDRKRMFAREGSGEISKNPYLSEGTVKRWRPVEFFGGDDEEEEDEGEEGEVDDGDGKD